MYDASNVWGKSGGNLDSQRSDLWVLDLQDAVQGLKGRFKDDYGFNGNSYLFFPQSVALPELKVKVEEIKKDNLPVMYPGYNEPISAVRANFLVDANSKGSSIYRFLYNWWVAGQSGRFPNSPQLGNNFIPDKFKYDVYVWFLSGMDSDQLQQAVSSFTKSGNSPSAVPLSAQLQSGQGFKLERTWVSSLQPSELNYTNVTNVLVTALLQPRQIIPLTSDEA
jgi:hypothetical protein